MRKIQKWTKRTHKKKAPKRSFLLPPVPRHLTFLPSCACLSSHSLSLRLFNGLSGIREALTIPSNLFDMSNHYDFVRKVAENTETVVGETHQVAT